MIVAWLTYIVLVGASICITAALVADCVVVPLILALRRRRLWRKCERWSK